MSDTTDKPNTSTEEGASVTPAVDSTTPENPEAPEAPEEQPKTPDTPSDEQPKTEDHKADEPLGEGGKRALEAEREKSKTLQAELDALKTTQVARTEFDTVTKERDELKAEVEKLQTTVRETAAWEKVSAAATEAGARNLKAVRKLVDLTAYDSEKDNAKDLIGQAAADFPELFTAPTQEGLGNPDGSQGRKQENKYFTKEQVDRMTPEEFKANRDHIYASRSQW